MSWLKRLFTRGTPPEDLSLWPYPLPASAVRLLLFHAVRVAEQTLPEKDQDMVEMLMPNPLENRARPSRAEPLMTPDDLEAFNLSRRLKMSADFFLCLNAKARKDPRGAERKIIRHSIAAIANRRDLNRMVQELSPRQVVDFIRDDHTACPQSRAFVGKTWASVAPELPLPGCNADICLCQHRAVIEF